MSASLASQGEIPDNAALLMTDAMLRGEELEFLTRRDIRVGNIFGRQEHPHRTVGRPMGIQLHVGSIVEVTVMNEQTGQRVTFPFDLRIDRVAPHIGLSQSELPSEFAPKTPPKIEDLRRRHEQRFKTKLPTLHKTK